MTTKPIQVGLVQGISRDYPHHPPFHPPAKYAEIVKIGLRETMEDNSVYAAVRQSLALLGLDLGRYGSEDWNPMGAYVRPGDKIVLKPNFVMHEFGPWKGSNSLTTHASILRAMIDYAYLAGGPDSAIVIADAPIQGADFDMILREKGIPEIQDYYWSKLKFEIQVVDLRKMRAEIDEESSFIKRLLPLSGDPSGYRIIDLASKSRLRQIDSCRSAYVVGDYDRTVTNAHHQAGKHEYLVSNTILNSDILISLPKLKTHSKVGVTVCLKNLVGIIGSKDCLPHHRLGKPRKGGDEFADQYPAAWLLSNRMYSKLQGRISLPAWKLLRTSAARFLKAGTRPRMAPLNGGNGRFYTSGSWHGNDTIWRIVEDLNRILFFYNPMEDRLGDVKQRRFFALVDGIKGMEGNGPLRGIEKGCGVLLAGEDPLAIDVTAATLMGLRWRRIRMLAGAAENHGNLEYSGFKGNESDIAIRSNVPAWQTLENIQRAHFGFLLPDGWQNYQEE